MKHLLLPIFTLASAVAGTSSGDLPPWMYVSTVTSDVSITLVCTGRPLPMDCEINSWTDTTWSWTLTKGPAEVFTLKDYDYHESETTTTFTTGTGNSVSTSPTPTSPPPTTGESGSTGSPSPTVATTGKSSAPEQSQGAAVEKNMRVGSTIVGGFLAALAIL